MIVNIGDYKRKEYAMLLRLNHVLRSLKTLIMG